MTRENMRAPSPDRSLTEAITEALADVAHFVKSPRRIESASLRFDGLLLFRAAAALRRYDRLTNPRLHARLGYRMRPHLELSEVHRRLISRALGISVTDIAKLPALSRSSHLPAARVALRMDGPEQTPERSSGRQRHRDFVVVVRHNLQRRTAAFKAGSPLDGQTITEIFAIVARAFSGEAQPPSRDTVRRAWIAAKAKDSALEEAEADFEDVRAHWRESVKAPPTPRPAATGPRAKASRSAAKAALDWTMRKRR